MNTQNKGEQYIIKSGISHVLDIFGFIQMAKDVKKEKDSERLFSYLRFIGNYVTNKSHLDDKTKIKFLSLVINLQKKVIVTFPSEVQS
ncbi:MAG: hypothetical protein WC495_06285 [Patescibacteria group bacterium]|jgi:hypothetical protein